jgi:hypothetical protein
MTQRHVDELRYQVGHVVEAFCDHTQKGQRVRDWLAGVVVQAEPKLVAVQFNEDVYLTDGWRIPDRILFFQQTSQHLRPTSRRRLTPKRRVRR